MGTDASLGDAPPAIAARRCWIFDLDGTLTVPNLDFDAIRAELGLPEGVLILEHLAGLPSARAAPLHERLAAIEARLAARVEGQPGVVELMDALAGRAARLGILTRNSRDNALASLARIGVAAHFDPAHVLGRDEAPPKPDPGGIRRLLDAFGAGPDDAVMVGDHSLDLEAGRAAGVATIHLDPDGEHRWPELTDLAVRGLREIPTALPEGAGR